MVDTDHVRVLLKGEQTVRCEKLTISYMRLPIRAIGRIRTGLPSPAELPCM